MEQLATYGRNNRRRSDLADGLDEYGGQVSTMTSRPPWRIATIGDRRVTAILIAGLVASVLSSLPSRALAAPDGNASAQSLADAMNAQPGLVVGAAFETRPSGAATAVSSESFGSMPTSGDTFAVLSTGRASDITSPNDSTSTTTDLAGKNYAGDSDFDVTVLRVDLDVPQGSNCLTADFRFYSEEYPEFVGSNFNDAFIAELGVHSWSTAGSQIAAPANFAFDPNNEPISINAAGVTSMTAEAADGTTFDGATPLLRAAAKVAPGRQALWLSIFDQGDHAWDSAVILDNLTTVSDSDCESGAQPTRPGAISGTFGCTWPHTDGSKTTLYYNYEDPHRYLGNVYQGGVNWSEIGSDIAVKQWPGIPYAIHIPLIDAKLPGDFWAVSLWANDCPTGSYSRVRVLFNRPGVDPLKDFMRTKVVTHEFGHALGLAHPPDNGSASRSDKSIMYQGVLPYNKPQSYDSGLMGELYP